MFEPSEREFDDDVQRSMSMFERARIGDVAAIAPRVPARLLLALDGSAQDDMSVRFARQLKSRFGCAVRVVDGRQNVATNEFAERIAATLDADAVPKTAGENYEQVLAAIEGSRCDLLIVPSPFERDLAKVGTDSTGTVIDVLLSRSKTPLLVVRDSYELDEPVFARASLVLVGENEAAPRAAEWAAGLVAPGGELELLLVLEAEIYENVRDLLRSLDPELNVTPEKLAEAMQRSRVRLHRALDKASQELDITYHLQVQQESETSRVEPAASSQHPLVVLALEKNDHLSQGFVHDRIRHSADAVLVVPQPTSPVAD